MWLLIQMLIIIIYWLVLCNHLQCSSSFCFFDIAASAFRDLWVFLIKALHTFKTVSLPVSDFFLYIHLISVYRSISFSRVFGRCVFSLAPGIISHPIWPLAYSRYSRGCWQVPHHMCLSCLSLSFPPTHTQTCKTKKLTLLRVRLNVSSS